MVTPEIREIIQKFIQKLKEQQISPSKVIVYGSTVTGVSHKDSDIDIAVISRDFGKDRFNEGVKLFEMASEIDPRIEPVPISEESFENDTWVPLIYEIRKHGIVIM
ncbi:MAG: nucleotidyltransferase domain-containing protein [Candidatus Hydrogenedentota bacterium]